MGIFNQKSKFKPAAPTIRREVIVLNEGPKRLPVGSDSKARASSSAGGLRVPAAASGTKKSRTSPGPPPAWRKSASPYPASSSDEKRLERKRKLAGGSATPHHRPSPASDRVEFDKDSDSDDGWEDALDAPKRRRSGPRRADLNRSLAAAASDEDEHVGEVMARMVHAADVASLSLGCMPLLGAERDDVAVELQYPGSQKRER